MALIFTNTEVTDQSFGITNAYARVGVQDNPSGTTLDTTVYVFVSEAAFADGKRPVNIMENAGSDQMIKTFFQFPYDRTTQSTDILSLAHQELKAYYDAQGHPVTIDLA